MDKVQNRAINVISARLSYAIYLTHPIIVHFLIGDVYGRFPKSLPQICLLMVNFIMLVYTFATLFHLLLEAPLANSTKLVFNKWIGFDGYKTIEPLVSKDINLNRVKDD